MAEIVVGGADYVLPAICTAAEHVGDCVYVSGPALNGIMQVAKASVVDPTRMPAVGIVLSKATTTDCAVMVFGVFYPGFLLTPSARYFVSASAGLVPAPIPSSRPFIVQAMGQALDENRLLLAPSRDLVRLNP